MATLENLRKDAKRWLKALRSGDADARARFERAYPNGPLDPVLRDVQHALAREHDHVSWTAMVDTIGREAGEASEASPRRSVDDYDAIARTLSSAYAAGDADDLTRLACYFGSPVTQHDVRAMVWRAVRTVREAKGAPEAFGPDVARDFIAREQGFGGWDALAAAVAAGAPPDGTPYAIQPVSVDAGSHAAGAGEGGQSERIAPRRRPAAGEWDEIIGVMKERRITSFASHGLVTDDVLARIAELEFLTELSLGGSTLLTDEGLQNLAEMPQLRHLDLSGWPGGREQTDRGLEVLARLPELRSFTMNWAQGITDAGASHLAHCDQLERVDLMGTRTGDGAIAALRHKPNLRWLQTGAMVTDAALPLFHEFPAFKSDNRDRGRDGAHGHADDDDDTRVRLMLDGPITNGGLSHLAGLEGLTAIAFFWHVPALTPDALAALTALPNLRALDWEGHLSDDVAMRHIGAMPNLRRLMVQGAVATDEGWAALARSRTIESIWGRECPNLTGPGFVALSTMPSLRRLGVSCARVDDDALASLPRFPALRQLTAIGVSDDGFRHVGRCERLDELACMYCRDTTDVATEHIAGMRGLRTYYAGATQITDRSLEILGTMASLESVEFYECLKVTNAGVALLARGPRLRKVSFSGLPHVSLSGTQVFAPGVRVDYHQ